MEIGARPTLRDFGDFFPAIIDIGQTLFLVLTRTYSFDGLKES